jgi:hypothetical protein
MRRSFESSASIHPWIRRGQLGGAHRVMLQSGSKRDSRFHSLHPQNVDSSIGFDTFLQLPDVATKAGMLPESLQMAPAVLKAAGSIMQCVRNLRETNPSLNPSPKPLAEE